MFKKKENLKIIKKKIKIMNYRIHNKKKIEK